MKKLWNVVTWQRVPIGEIPFKQNKYETKVLTLYAIGYILFAFVIGVLIQHYPLPLLGALKFNQDFWYACLFKIIALLSIPYWLYYKKWGYSFSQLLAGWRLSVFSLAILLMGFTAGFFLNSQHLQKILPLLKTGDVSFGRMFLAILLPLVTAGIPEELFFRGFLQTHFEKQFGRVFAILIATLLFTAWHLPTRFLLSSGVEGEAGDFFSVMLHTGVPVYVLGFLFAWHWDRYRNIVLLMVTHWAVDILPCVSSFLGIHF